MRPDPDDDRLIQCLRTWARGDLRLESSLELLVSHRHWLHRDDFTTACVRAGYGDLDGELLAAWIDWPAAAAAAYGPDTLPCSDSERQVLALAASLAGATVPVPLGELLTGLDEANTARVLDAVAHTTGHRNANRNN